ILEVADSGPGIPAELQAKVFEAFFTTKAAGEGTGLGLSLCRGIIEEHGGTLTLGRSDPSGTSFVIELPLVAPPLADAGATAIAEETPAEPGRVLVVDDEVGLAEVVAEAIERDGHRATIATDGAMALDMLGREPYDLIVSDSKMPMLDGER